jgi:hypothetical protein
VIGCGFDWGYRCCHGLLNLVINEPIAAELKELNMMRDDERHEKHSNGNEEQ